MNSDNPNFRTAEDWEQRYTQANEKIRALEAENQLLKEKYLEPGEILNDACVISWAELKDVRKVKAERDALNSQVAELRKCAEFYADTEHSWFAGGMEGNGCSYESEMGNKARQTLASIDTPKPDKRDEAIKILMDGLKAYASLEPIELNAIARQAIAEAQKVMGTNV